jgi:hypothetical protein
VIFHFLNILLLELPDPILLRDACSIFILHGCQEKDVSRLGIRDEGERSLDPRMAGAGTRTLALVVMGLRIVKGDLSLRRTETLCDGTNIWRKDSCFGSAKITIRNETVENGKAKARKSLVEEWGELAGVKPVGLTRKGKWLMNVPSCTTTGSFPPCYYVESHLGFCKAALTLYVGLLACFDMIQNLRSDFGRLKIRNFECQSLGVIEAK